MTFGEVLKYFKESETPESIVSLTDSADLRNGVVAWKSVLVRYKKQSECTEQSDTAKWEWLWSNIEFDLSNFGLVAGVRGQDTNNLFFRLKGLRLIYPDGTINNFGARYLQAVIISKLPKQKKSESKG
jgi:hypothetical protein